MGLDMSSMKHRRIRRSGTGKVAVHLWLWHLAGSNSASFTRRRTTEEKFCLPMPCSAAKAHCCAPGPPSRHAWGFVGAPQALPNPSFNASPNGWPGQPFLGQLGYRPIQVRPGQPPGPR
jgi:hypothetical protein